MNILYGCIAVSMDRGRYVVVIRSAIITAAGLGTRLLPYSKEIPKEMLPIIVRRGNSVVVVPVLHYIFESLYEVGVRKFYFVVGRGKRVIEDYFTPDKSYVEFLRNIGKSELADILDEFYRKIEDCDIVMVNQPTPKGFGDAVLRVEPFITDNDFFVHAGDDIIYPNHVWNLQRLIEYFERYRPKAVFLYEYSEIPERYGVIVGHEKNGYIEVLDIIEKPTIPPSNYVVVAIYIFNKSIFDALKITKPSSGEHQLTDAIRYLVKKGETVYAIKVQGNRLDFGNPNSFLNALKTMVNELRDY